MIHTTTTTRAWHEYTPIASRFCLALSRSTPRTRLCVFLSKRRRRRRPLLTAAAVTPCTTVVEAGTIDRRTGAHETTSSKSYVALGGTTVRKPVAIRWTNTSFLPCEPFPALPSIVGSSTMYDLSGWVRSQRQSAGKLKIAGA